MVSQLGVSQAITYANVHVPPDSAVGLGSANSLPVPIPSEEVQASPPHRALCWVQLPSGWSVREVSGNLEVLYPGQAGENAVVPVPDVQVKYEKDVEKEGVFLYWSSPFVSIFLEPLTKGPHYRRWQMLYVTNGRAFGSFLSRSQAPLAQRRALEY